QVPSVVRFRLSRETSAAYQFSPQSITVRQIPLVAIESPRCTSDMSRSVWMRKRTSPPTLCRLSTLPRLSIIPVNIFISFSILLPEGQLGTNAGRIHTTQFRSEERRV